MTIECKWAVVPGYAGAYEVNDRGGIRSWKRAGLPVHMRASTDKWGYKKLKLSILGKKKTYFVHTFVLLSFVGPCPEGMQSRHIDGDCANNALKNLAWGTKEKNEEDKHRHGTSNRGERNHFCRLTEYEVGNIKEEISCGYRIKDIAEWHNLAPCTVSGIKHGRSWGWLK